jgi:hypothetical protein
MGRDLVDEVRTRRESLLRDLPRGGLLLADWYSQGKDDFPRGGLGPETSLIGVIRIRRGS